MRSTPILIDVADACKHHLSSYVKLTRPKKLSVRCPLQLTILDNLVNFGQFQARKSKTSQKILITKTTK